MKNIILIDGNSLLFRAYYATASVGNLMVNRNGIPTNALYGFANMIEKIMNENNPEYILVAFDYGKKTFRNDLLANYKGTRKETPEELVAQFDLAREYLNARGIVYKEVEGYEADDIIGTISKDCEADDFIITIFSGDQDMLQLVTDKTSVHRNKLVAGKTVIEVNTPEVLYQKYQLVPDQIRDLKGLMGDKSDNIPGIAGVGEKTALKLLHEYQTVENVMEHADQIKGKLGEKVRDQKEIGLVSKQIATILREVPLTYNMDEFKYSEPDTKELANFYRQYDMYSLLKRMEATSATTPTKKVEATIVSHIDQVKDDFSLVVGVYDKNYHKSIVLGYALYNKEIQSYIRYEDALNDQNFKEILRNPAIKKYGYDIKRQKTASLWNQIEIQGYDFDLQLSSYILNPSLKDDVKIVCDYHELYDLPYEEDVFGKGAKRHIPEDEVIANYYVTCAKAIYDLKEPVIQKLKNQDQLDLYNQIELPLTHILADMEYTGIKVDVNVLKQQEKMMEEKIFILEKEIYQLVGFEFNISSPKQLGEVLFEHLQLPFAKKTKTGYSTGADVLEKLIPYHPIIQRVLDYRTFTKLNSTYLVGLQDQVFMDGKIHTIYNQALTQTGRLSSTDPNLQNIPIRYEEGKQVRKAFVPTYDYIMSFDYSQIELRILASLANVESLIQAFNNDVDIHTKTASDIFDVPLDQVNSNQRRQAKAVNFGIIYGMSDFGLSEQIGVSVASAKLFIEKYFTSYPGIKNYMNDIVEFAKIHGYVSTMLNRKRYIPEINDKNYVRKELGKRLAMNSPIQGSAADLLKIAMIHVDEMMKQANVTSKMILQVHDELVFDVVEEELEIMNKIVKEAMELAYPMKVLLKAEGSYGKSWYDLK